MNQKTNQEALLHSFKQQRLERFIEIIHYWDIDVDYFYGEPDNGTLLDLACRSSGNSNYVLILLLNGASIWRKNEVTGKLALDEAGENSDVDTTRYLRMASQRYILEAEDEFGNNPMQIAVKKNDIASMKLIARYYNQTTEYNPKVTPLVMLKGSIQAARVFIDYFDVDMEFERDSQGRVRTCREIILQNYPELKAELPTPSENHLPVLLFAYLQRGAPELFLSRAAEVSTEILNDSEDEGKKTYLHVASEYNHINVVDMLLKRNINPNKLAQDLSIPKWTGTPIMMAAKKGHYEIVVRLLDNPQVELQITGLGSVLHSVIRGLNEQVTQEDNHGVILRLFLDRKFPATDRLDIDHADEKNMTPLHFAIASQNDFATRLLIHAGANLYLEDSEGKLLLTLIPVSILEGYLDNCIRSHKKSVSYTKSVRVITFHYDIFRRRDQYSIATDNEMEFFSLIERVPELRKLFKHPLSKSFLHIKWCFVKKHHYVNLAFYLLFCLSLSSYIFQSLNCPVSSTSSNSSRLNDTGINHLESSTLCDQFWQQPITLLLYIILILRELCQFFVSIQLYVSLPENRLEIVIIIFVGYFFLTEINAHVAATVILISWIEFVLLLGKHPSLSIYIEMFKKVALNFAKFLVLYSILVASFAYSFFILFNYNTKKQNETNVDETNRINENSINCINSWRDWKVSLIKSIIMMTGEFDVSTLPLGRDFSYSYVFFIFFVFLVTMVLYSLLHGLAVSDTQAIMEDAEVVALISRVKLISQLERIAIRNPFQCFRSRWPNFFNRKPIRQLESGCLFFRNHIYRDDIILFTGSGVIGDTCVVSVRPGQNNLISLRPRLENYQSLQEGLKKDTISSIINTGRNIGKMPSTIVEQAKQILEKRNQSNSVQNFDQNLLTNVLKKHSSKYKWLDESVHYFSKQIRGLKHEIAERDKKLLQNIKRNNKLLESVAQALAHLKQTK